MASTSKCPFCGATISSEDKMCPSCGAPNENYVVDTPRTIFLPKTIEEMKEYCAERGMPLLRMRFFIGENYKEPKAFGIYQDGNEFVVYKNKANGERAVRYRGPDEAHAVDEIFTKLLEECHNRGIYPDGKPGGGSQGSSSVRRSGGGSNRSSANIPWGVVIWLIIMLMVIASLMETSKNNGYYLYNNRYYYNYDSDWYEYSGGDYWSKIYDFPVDDYEEYYVGKTFNSEWGTSNFKESSAYREIQENNSSSSNDYDSWDSSDTDWDSDW